MPSTVARDQGKTAFIKQVLFENPYANARVVNEAWEESGREGSISTTLVNKMRSEAGLTGNLRRRSGAEATPGAVAGGRPYTGKKRGRKPKSAQVAAEASTTAEGFEPARSVFTSSVRGRGARVSRLAEIEADVDRVLFKVMSLEGLAEVEDALRAVRRLLYKDLG